MNEPIEELTPAEALVSGGLATISEAKDFLNVARSTLYGLMDSGQLAYVKIGASRRIPRRALVRLAAEGLVGR